MEDSKRALLGNKIVEADGDRAWKGLESPHESHLVDRWESVTVPEWRQS